jgi:DNA (cytosine-5)-methyltransferase 3A
MASCDISDNFIKVDTNLKKSANQDKANCFTAGGNSGGLHSDMTTEQMLEPRFDGKTNCLTSVQKDNLVMQLNQSTESNGCQPYQQNRVYDIDGISPALMAQMSCGTHAILIPEATKKGFTEINPGECFDFENPKSETRRGRKMEDKSNCLMAKETDFMHYTKDFKIRRLTPTECERLQTVPDQYTGIVSDTQRYRMLGNGWTVDVIAHIFSFMALQKPKSEGEKIIKTA